MFHKPDEVMPEKTARLFNAFIDLWPAELAEKFTLVGGTALALRIAHRTSEDLDLFSKEERISPQTSDEIQKFLKNLKNEYGYIASVRGGDQKQVDYWIDGVKVSFCARGLDFLDEDCGAIGNFKIASINTLIAMKGKAIQAQRTKSRDFFDVATLIHHGIVDFPRVWEIMVSKYPDAPFAESMLVKRLLETPLDDDDEGFSSLETFNDLPVEFEELRGFMEDKIFDFIQTAETTLKRAIAGEYDDDMIGMRYNLGGDTLLQALFAVDENRSLLSAAAYPGVDLFKKNYAEETILDDLSRCGREDLIVELIRVNNPSILSVEAFTKERSKINPSLCKILEDYAMPIIKNSFF